MVGNDQGWSGIVNNGQKFIGMVRNFERNRRDELKPSLLLVKYNDAATTYTNLVSFCLLPLFSV